MESLLVKSAIAYAAVKHKDQKYGDGPYTNHLAHVAEVLQRFGVVDEEMLAAAWLHDSVEDTDATASEIELIFGARVSDIVYRVTNELGKNRKERHEKTYPKIQTSEDATTLKLADRIANVEKSVEDHDPQRDMYLKEYPYFREMLHKPTGNEAMWRHLDFLLGFAQ
jgi:(p)ppGpp synthase/HD superfamily hydrolase